MNRTISRAAVGNGTPTNNSGTPIVPVSIVGAEEIYPMIGNIRPLARLLGAPYFPMTPTFPWLGPLGLVPLPSKWLIEFGEPIPTDDYYSLYGVFASSVEPEDLPALEWPGSGAPGRSAEFASKLEAAKKARDDYLAARRAEVVKDFGYRATHEMAVLLKALAARYYGQAPRRAYYAGCSTGGQQGLQSADDLREVL